MAIEEKKLQQFEKIGGLLWFPAIWTVTNFAVAGWLATIAPIIGGILMALAVLNAYLFWARKSIYRWFFILKSFVGIFLIAMALGPQGIGAGSALTLIFMVYLVYSERARGTFTRPLFSKAPPAVVAE
ncbi:hypothetical protein [Pseudomonas sp. S2_C03]